MQFSDQATVKDRKLEVFKYEMVDGLVEALSRNIENEKKKTNAVCELTLDQNGLSDAQLARILRAVYTQGRNF